MNISGEYQVPAPRQQVWRALQDAEVLCRALPGCERLERVAEDRFEGRIIARIGPVKAGFDVCLTIEEQQPPEAYTLSGEGKGGVAGFANGRARVQLSEQGGATVLAYTADVRVGGKVAQVGSRLFQGAINKIIGGFFEKLAAILPEYS